MVYTRTPAATHDKAPPASTGLDVVLVVGAATYCGDAYRLILTCPNALACPPSSVLAFTSIKYVPFGTLVP